MGLSDRYGLAVWTVPAVTKLWYSRRSQPTCRLNFPSQIYRPRLTPSVPSWGHLSIFIIHPCEGERRGRGDAHMTLHDSLAREGHAIHPPPMLISPTGSSSLTTELATTTTTNNNADCKFGTNPSLKDQTFSPHTPPRTKIPEDWSTRDRPQHGSVHRGNEIPRRREKQRDITRISHGPRRII